MVRGSNPGGGEILRTCPDRPWGPPSLLYNGYRVFLGGKERPGRDADPSPPSNAVGHERIELYLYSPYGQYGLYRTSVPVQGLHCPVCHLNTGCLIQLHYARLQLFYETVRVLNIFAYSTTSGFLVDEFYCSGPCQKINFKPPKNGSSAQEILENAASSIFLLFLCPCAWRVVEQETQRTGMAWVGGHHLAPPPSTSPSHLSGQHISTSLHFKETPTGFFRWFIIDIYL
jgi:hypothetical protein